ncbi:MAG: acyl-CoA thioesterase [Acetobacter sp.]|nr:acyl-CoA thioesterase [Acetobacter sp.]
MVRIERSAWTNNNNLVARVVALHRDTNAAGDVFGGWVVSHMDLAAVTMAEDRAGCKCVTVSIDGLVFRHPMMVGDELNVYARITKIGRTSIAIEVEAVRRIRRTSICQKVTHGYFTYVAIGVDGRPRPVDIAPWLPQ